MTGGFDDVHMKPKKALPPLASLHHIDVCSSHSSNEALFTPDKSVNARQGHCSIEARCARNAAIAYVHVFTWRMFNTYNAGLHPGKAPRQEGCRKIICFSKRRCLLCQGTRRSGLYNSSTAPDPNAFLSFPILPNEGSPAMRFTWSFFM